MDNRLKHEKAFPLDGEANQNKRKLALLGRCGEYRERLKRRNPLEVARLAAMNFEQAPDGGNCLVGDHLGRQYRISWPSLAITDYSEAPADLAVEILWLHYLDRADGYPLSGRWVNLSEIGGLFYQQAFQGYSGDELAAAWGDNISGLKEKCLSADGWFKPGLADLAFEWRILPRLPVLFCYRKPIGEAPAWATILFDAAAAHYVAADVAAIAGKDLSDRIMP